MRAPETTRAASAEDILRGVGSVISVLCPHCRRESSPYFRTRDYNQRISAENFQYYSCPSCGLIHLFPIPSDLERYYQGDYGPYALPTSLEGLAAETEKVRFRIDLVQKFVSTGRLLEIGPSFGAFALVAKRAGFEVETIEMDTRCCQFLTDVVGVKCVHTSDVLAALKPATRYDVIALWHNIEHLPDPWIVLRMLSESLLPEGILVISTPNPEALQFRVFGRFWVNLDAPRHLELIPAPLLTRFMGDHGLTAVLTTTTDNDGLTLNRHGWRSSMSNVFTFLRNVSRKVPKSVFRATNSNVVAANGNGHVLAKLFRPVTRRVVTSVLNPLEKKGWYGSAYTIVFKKAL